MKDKVIVYTSNDCIECTYVKMMLKEKGISFEVRNISESKEYQQEVEKYGFLGVPVTVFGETAIKGLNEELEEILNTLNY